MGFAHINYFSIYDDGCKSRMVVNLDIINTASVNDQLVRSSPLCTVKLAEGDGVSLPGPVPSDSPRCRPAPSISDALLFAMMPERETVLIDVDAFAAFAGVIYCGQDGYLVNQSSCFN